MNTQTTLLAAAILSITQAMTPVAAETLVGNDLNSAQGADPAIAALFSANRGTNGGGDQSLQFGDQLESGAEDDVLIGGLGTDLLFGGDGDDVIVGGTEDFNPFNRDFAFGEGGNDVFIWTPGDGNDFFDGGDGEDVLILSLVGETRDAAGNESSSPVFAVSPPNQPGSGDFDGIFLDPDTGLPVVNLVNSPGFCEVLDAATSPEVAQGLNELNMDHLVRFILRGPANAFDSALAADPNLDPATLDNGLRVAVHLRNAEFVVCQSRSGEETEVFDLRDGAVVKTGVHVLPEPAYSLVTR